MKRLFGGPDDTPKAEPLAPRPDAPSGDTATVRRIIAELEQLDPARRKLLAGFAYILSRAAHSDLSFSEDETRLIEKIVSDIGQLPEAQAVLVVEIAKNQSDMFGGTEDYLVTREFAQAATDEQRIRTVKACFMIVAADHEITAEEYAEMTQIATELGLSREELNVIRREYRDQLVAIQKMRAGGAAGAA